MSETKPGMIYALIPKIAGDVGAISKERRNKEQGYAFRGIEDLYQAIHPVFVKHGVFCAPKVKEKTTENYSSKSGTAMRRVDLIVSHTFFASDGSSVEVVTAGEGMDSADKSTNKAMSAAMKYALIELLCIPTEDVEDADRTTPSFETPKPRIPTPESLGASGYAKIAPQPISHSTGAVQSGPALPTGSVPSQIPTIVEIGGRDKGRTYASFSKDEAIKAIEYWEATLKADGKKPQGKLIGHLAALYARLEPRQTVAAPIVPATSVVAPSTLFDPPLPAFVTENVPLGEQPIWNPDEMKE